MNNWAARQLAARCGQGLLLLRLGDDGPIRRRADVAANELKLRIVGRPHELSRPGCGFFLFVGPAAGPYSFAPCELAPCSARPA